MCFIMVSQPCNINALIYDYDFAINMYSDLISLAPGSVSALNNRGICLIKKAIERYDLILAKKGCEDIEAAVLLLNANHEDPQRQVCIQALTWAKNVIEVLENVY